MFVLCIEFVKGRERNLNALGEPATGLKMAKMGPARLEGLLLGASCLAFWCSMIVAQDTSWEETANAARTAESQGRLPEAEHLYLAALRKAEQFGPGDLRLATSLENLGMFYFGRAKHSDAESLLRRAFETRQKSKGRIRLNSSVSAPI